MIEQPSVKAAIAVVGAGVMGRGVAQLFCVAGHDVILHDAQPGAAENGRTQILALLDSLVDKGRLTQDVRARAGHALTVADDLSGLASADIVIEAIVEDIEAKRALIAALEPILREDAIIASNTSSLLIAEIAGRSLRPDRIAGLHFFNPVPLMKVVEVIGAVRTAPHVLAALTALVDGAGHRAVVAADQPGFLVNHAGRGLYTEGLAILEDRIASHADIDLVLRESAGFRMGPFELFDLTGIDVSGRVLQGIFEQFQFEPRFRPSSLVAPRIAAGLFGRKTGKGWYDYPAAPYPPAPGEQIDPTGTRVWIEPSAPHFVELASAVMEAGGVIAPDPSDPDVLIVIQPWGREIASECADRKLDPQRTVAVDPLPSPDRRRTLMISLMTRPEITARALALLGSGPTPATVIADSPGFVVQRVLAVIVNIAAHIAQRGIASVADIDDAVRLGLGYPKGPLTWGDEVGAGRIVEILNAIHATTGDPRYRVSPWLRQRAALGVSLRHEANT